MRSLKNILGFSKTSVKNYADFWKWFATHEKKFAKAIREQKGIEKVFFSPVSKKLGNIKSGFYFLVRANISNQIEMIFTADGDIQNFAFTEEIVASAPALEGWVFIAFKQPHRAEDIKLEFSNHVFSAENIFFCPEVHKKYPDLIDLTIVYTDPIFQDEAQVRNGVHLFLENYLGEMKMATLIDHINISFSKEAVKELIAINKLNDYLNWREKEFIEKYKGVRMQTQNDQHSVWEAVDAEGNSFFALFNTDLMHWDKKASHPWMVNIEIGYDGRKNNGMPDDAMSDFLQKFEEDLLKEMKDADGYLYIGRLTGNNLRQLFFACKDYHLPSKILAYRKLVYKGKLKMEFDIFKDKYWRFIDQFMSE